MMKIIWKRKITYIYRKYPRTTTIKTVSSYAVSIRVYHSSLFEDPCTYACYTITQCQVMLFRYVYTTVPCLKTHALMPVIPVFNNADVFMPFCRRYVSRHF